MRAAAAIALAALLAGCAHYEIVGYYASWKDPIAFDARDVTTVNYAFIDFAFEQQTPGQMPEHVDISIFGSANEASRVLGFVARWNMQARHDDVHFGKQLVVEIQFLAQDIHLATGQQSKILTLVLQRLV